MLVTSPHACSAAMCNLLYAISIRRGQHSNAPVSADGVPQLRVAHTYLGSPMWLVSNLQLAGPFTAKECDDALV